MSEMKEVHAALGRIEAKADLTLQRLDGMDSRIRKLEQFKARVLGMFAVVVAAPPIIWHGVKSWFSGKGAA